MVLSPGPESSLLRCKFCPVTATSPCPALLSVYPLLGINGHFLVVVGGHHELVLSTNGHDVLSLNSDSFDPSHRLGLFL